MENLYGNWLRSVEMSGVIDYRKTGSIQSCNIDIDLSENKQTHCTNKWDVIVSSPSAISGS